MIREYSAEWESDGSYFVEGSRIRMRNSENLYETRLYAVKIDKITTLTKM